MGDPRLACSSASSARLLRWACRGSICSVCRSIGAGDGGALDDRIRNQPRAIVADCDRVDGPARVAWRSPTWRSPARALGSVAFVGVGLSLATSGHAATAPPEWLTRPALFVHGVGVAFWLGALVPSRRAGRGGNRTCCHRCCIAFRRRHAGRRRAGADRPGACDHPARKHLRAGRHQLRHHPLDQARVGDAAARAGRAEPLLAHAGACDGLPLGTANCAIDPARVYAAPSASSPWSPAGASRRRRVRSPREAPLAIHIHTDKAMFQVLVSPGKVGVGRFRAAADERRCQPVADEGNDADAEPA